METWKAESRPGRQFALACAGFASGFVLVWGFRQHGGDSNATAGFWLGWLLLVIGSWGLACTGRQTICIDPIRRLITVEDHLLFGTRRRQIEFADIRDVAIGYLGRKSNFVGWYYLVLSLRDGTAYPLFQLGRFYEGTAERGVVETWRDRLLVYLQKGIG